MPTKDRVAFAKRTCGSAAALGQVAYGNKEVSLGRALVLSAWAKALGADIEVEDIPLCREARQQLAALRKAGAHKPRRPRVGAVVAKESLSTGNPTGPVGDGVVS